jgi:hypothetical protein
VRGVIWALAVLAFVAVDPTAAAAKQPRANPVSWEPPDAKAGEPVDIVLTLSGVGDGMHDDVEVVVLGSGQERRFPAIALGSGRYRTTITFPFGSEWEVRVDYGRGATIPLGKGGVRVDGPPLPKSERAAPTTRSARVAGVLALVLGLSGLALAASRSASRGIPGPPG